MASDTVAPGDSLTAVVTVENEGFLAGERRVELVVDGESTGVTRTVELEPGERRELRLERELSDPGVYAVRVDDEPAGTVSVVGDGVESIAETRVDGDTATFDAGPLDRITFQREASGGVVVERRASLPDDVPAPAGRLVLPVTVRAPDDTADAVASLRLSVPRGELGDAAPSDVRILRYDASDDEWRSVETSVVDESDGRVTLRGGVSEAGLLALVAAPSDGSTATGSSGSSTAETPAAAGGDDGERRSPSARSEPGRIGAGPLVAVVVAVVIAVAAAVALGLRGGG